MFCSTSILVLTSSIASAALTALSLYSLYVWLFTVPCGYILLRSEYDREKRRGKWTAAEVSNTCNLDQ